MNCPKCNNHRGKVEHCDVCLGSGHVTERETALYVSRLRMHIQEPTDPMVPTMPMTQAEWEKMKDCAP